MCYFKYALIFFDSDIEVEDLQLGNLKILPKKGDESNPNNWRGMNLIDLFQS